MKRRKSSPKLSLKIVRTNSGYRSFHVPMDGEDDEVNVIVPQVETSNRYNALHIQNVNPGTNSGSSTNTITPNRTGDNRPPPIMVLNKRSTEITPVLKLAQIDFTLKLLSNGTKIFLRSTIDHTAVKDILMKEKWEFFTHRNKDEKYSRFVLYGLDDLPPDDIMKDLNDLKLFPSSIKKMQIKKPKFIGQSNYLVSFPSNRKITLSELKPIYAVLNTRVTWKRYEAPTNTVSQCHNCQGFSHGSDNCHVNPNCVKCAKQHHSSKCPDSKKHQKIDKHLLLCVNCGEKHAANYKYCQARLNYIKDMELLKAKRRNINTKQRGQPTTFKEDPRLTGFNLPSSFPEAPWTQRNRQGLDSVNSNTNSIKINNNGFSKNLINTSSLSNAPLNTGNTINSNTSLYTYAECMTIFDEFITTLSKCKSKEEQVRALGSISLKYLSVT